MNGLRATLPFVVLALLFAAGTEAKAACPQRLGIDYGDTLESIARACGISVERLRGVNPGLNPRTLQAGTFINVPRPVLSSPQLPVGRPSVRIAPPLVPPAIITSPSSTVIAPPPPPVIHRYDIPGLDDQPGQWPPRPGHLLPRQ